MICGELSPRSGTQEWHPRMLGKWPGEPTPQGMARWARLEQQRCWGSGGPCSAHSRSFHLLAGCRMRLPRPFVIVTRSNTEQRLGSYWMISQWEMETITFVAQEWVSLACWVGDTQPHVDFSRPRQLTSLWKGEGQVGFCFISWGFLKRLSDQKMEIRKHVCACVGACMCPCV